MVVISDIRAAEIFFKYYLCYMEKKKKKEVKKPLSFWRQVLIAVFAKQ